MSIFNLSLDTANLGQDSQQPQPQPQQQLQQRRPRHGKVVYDLHAQFISFYDKSQPSPNDLPVFWQGSRDRGSLKFRFRTRDGGSICVLLDDGNYEVRVLALFLFLLFSLLSQLCMPLECVTYLGMLPINDKNANDPDTLNVRDDKYALNLERCLSSGRITFELGIDDNSHFDFRRREPNRYVRDYLNNKTRDAAYSAKHMKITIHHSVTNELATAMIALVVRSLKSKFYPHHLNPTPLNFANDGCNTSDDLWYISPRFNVHHQDHDDHHAYHDYHLQDILGIYNKISTKSPSLSPASSIPTLSPVSPDNYLPLPMSRGAAVPGVPGVPRQMTSYMGMKVLDSPHALHDATSSKGVTRSQSLVMKSLGRLSIDDLGGASGASAASSPSPSSNKATPNIIVGGGRERAPGDQWRQPPPGKVSATRAGRAQSIGTIGDRRKIF
ncbi:hypothetical protein E3P99_02692 [Wallemia hederae]|uniref:Uncharacterized protein n=1 Tax=Wallemia hederae TaxID=1540922 RepID=A0A4T0FLI3_9BASI|nr:hypothetical protein E3P99_02692 [Wallemia hederae]